jgi:hypothetical protein
MDEESAKFMVIAITAVGALAWLAGLTVVLRASRERQQSALRAAERFSVEGEFAPGTIIGETEVEGHPEELSSKLASQLARESVGPFGPVKIVARDSREVAFEPAGAPINGFRGGRIQLTKAGPRTKVEYALETSSNGLLIGAWIALALGLAALIVAPWLAFTYALPSPNPNVRAQAFQVFQMVHFLWPPFLFAFLSRQPGRMFRARMDALVHNLPYS